MFHAYDVDGSGTLDYEEVQAMLGNLGHSSLAGASSSSSSSSSGDGKGDKKGTGSRGSTEFDELGDGDGDRTKLRALWRELDEDGDGTVSMAEFVVWCWERQTAAEGASEDDVEELCGRIFDVAFDESADG